MLEQLFKEIFEAKKTPIEFFNELPIQYQQKIFNFLYNQKSWKNLLKIDGDKIIIRNTDEYLGMLLESNNIIPTQDNEEKELKFINSDGNEETHIIIYRDGKLKFRNLENEEIEIFPSPEDPKLYCYNSNYTDIFYAKLEACYSDYEDTQLSIYQLFRKQKIDGIIKRWDEVSSAESYYYLITTLFNDNGTFFHSASTKLSHDQLQILLEYLNQKNRNILQDYLSLFNKEGRNVVDHASIYANKNIHSLLKNYSLRIFDNDNIIDNDTHNRANHKTSDISLVKLTENFITNKGLAGVITRKQSDRQLVLTFTDQYNKAINDEIDQLRLLLENLKKLSNEELYQYIKPSLAESLQKSRPEDRELVNLLEDFRFQINTSLRMVNDIINHNRFCFSNESQFFFRASDLSTCGPRYKDLLAIAFHSLTDNNKIINKGEDSDKINFKIFIEHLYEIRRGYNDSKLGSDNTICSGGTVNKLASSLQSIHQDSCVKFINQDVIIIDIEKKLKTLLQANSHKLDPLKLLQWYKDNSPQNIFNPVKKDILTLRKEIAKEYSEYFNKQQINIFFRQAFRDLNFQKELSNMIRSIDLSRLSIHHFNDLLDKNKIPFFFKLENRYINIIDYLRLENPKLFTSYVKNNCIKLLFNNIMNLDHLSKESIEIVFEFNPNLRDLNNEFGLTWAVKRSKHSLIKKKLKSGVNEETCYEAFLFSSYLNQKDTIMHFLADKREIVNYQNSKGESGLIPSVVANNAEIMKILIAYDIDLNLESIHKMTALKYSIKKEFYESIYTLLLAGASPNQINSFPFSHNNAEISKLLIEYEKDPLMFEIIHHQKNPLNLVTALMNLQKCKLYQEYSISIKIGNPKIRILGTEIIIHCLANSFDDYGNTALVLAIKLNKFENIKQLIHKGENPNLATKITRMTPLMYGVQNGNFEIISLLLRSGASINHQTDLGNVLNYAIKNKKFDMAEFLLQSKPNLESADYYGNKSFFYGVQQKDINTINLLYEAGADINSKNYDNNTPLHQAIRVNDADVIRCLFIKGANPWLKNIDRKSPIDLSMEYDDHFVRQEIFRYVRDPIRYIVELNDNDPIKIIKALQALHDSEFEFTNEHKKQIGNFLNTKTQRYITNRTAIYNETGDSYQDLIRTITLPQNQSFVSRLFANRARVGVEMVL